MVPLAITIFIIYYYRYFKFKYFRIFYKYTPKLPKNVGFMARKWPKMVLAPKS